MIILPDHKAVYISHQRCASHTMFNVLRDKYGGTHYKDDGYHGRQVPSECRDWYWFSTCRNPYSLAVSIWRSTRRDMALNNYTHWWRFAEIATDDTFLAFTEVLVKLDWTWMPTYGIDPTGISMSQGMWFEPVFRNMAVIIQIETLAIGVNALPFWRKEVNLPLAANRTDEGKASWQSYYTDEAVVANVQKWAGRDFEIFNYGRESYKLPES